MNLLVNLTLSACPLTCPPNTLRYANLTFNSGKQQARALNYNEAGVGPRDYLGETGRKVGRGVTTEGGRLEGPVEGRDGWLGPPSLRILNVVVGWCYHDVSLTWWVG